MKVGVSPFQKMQILKAFFTFHTCKSKQKILKVKNVHCIRIASCLIMHIINLSSGIKHPNAFYISNCQIQDLGEICVLKLFLKKTKTKYQCCSVVWTYLDQRSYSSRDEHQQARLFIEQVEENHQGAETPPQHWESTQSY